VVAGHGWCLSCRRIGRATRGLLAIVAGGGDGFGPAGPERSGGWQPGNYFASRCKAAPPLRPVAFCATDKNLGRRREIVARRHSNPDQGGGSLARKKPAAAWRFWQIAAREGRGAALAGKGTVPPQRRPFPLPAYTGSSHCHGCASGRRALARN